MQVNDGWSIVERDRFQVDYALDVPSVVVDGRETHINVGNVQIFAKSSISSVFLLRILIEAAMGHLEIGGGVLCAPQRHGSK